MRVWRAARSPKSILESFEWKRGKMPRNAFPLTKSRGYVLGATWDWCVIKLAADGRTFRLLVAFDPAKEQYRAWLGLEDGGDQALVARLEFHPTHNGWHCHLKPGDLSAVVRGVVKERGERTLHCQRPNEFGITQLNAITVAFRIFNVQPADAGGLLQ